MYENESLLNSELITEAHARDKKIKIAISKGNVKIIARVQAFFRFNVKSEVKTETPIMAGTDGTTHNQSLKMLLIDMS